MCSCKLSEDAESCLNLLQRQGGKADADMMMIDGARVEVGTIGEKQIFLGGSLRERGRV